MRLLLSTLVLGALATGCYASAGTHVGYSGTVTATTVGPDLVYVSPGVQVIADYNEPIFYSNGYYWRETSGVWYRSSYHTGGWIYAAPPRAVVSIGNRGHYRHYRPSGWRPRHNHYSSRPAYQAPRREVRREHVRDERRGDRRDERRESTRNKYKRDRR